MASAPRGGYSPAATPIIRADPMTLRVLLVEGDPLLQRELGARLESFGHVVIGVGDGMAAVSLATCQVFDIAVLDWLIPGLGGLGVLRQLRGSGMNLPVLVHSPLAQTLDKVEALDAGADDYMVKPADPLELEARLRALVRARRTVSRAADTIGFGDIVASPLRQTAWRQGQPLGLSPTEFKLLLELLEGAGSVVPRALLIERVWGAGFTPATNIVDVHVRQLRLKLMRHGSDPVATVRGIGYRLRT